MPKINLLPQERNEAAARRRSVAMALFVALVYLSALALVFVMLKGRETAAEEDLAAQLQRNELLRAEVASLEPYAELRREYEDGVDLIREALSGDVAWGRVLGDFGRMIPQGVWLENLTIQAEAPDEESLEGAGPMPYGSLSMSGQGFGYADVATWLVTLDSPDWDDVGAAWASNVTLSEGEAPTPAVGEDPGSPGSPDLVGWTITGLLGENALTDRLETRIPEVEE
jgi:Tfp pilus assembly protein PilN